MEQRQNYEQALRLFAKESKVVDQGLLRGTGDGVNKFYLSLYALVRTTLNLVPEEERFTDSPDKQVIDIRGIARFLGIEIVAEDLQQKEELFENEVSGYLDGYYSSEGAKCWTIYVNKQLGGLEQRYVIAHELSHYLLNVIRGVRDTKYSINSLIPKSTEEQVCDIMASFFLLQPGTMLSIMEEYKEKRRKENNMMPIQLYDWLRHLGYITEIADYNLLSCYQNVRYLLAIAREDVQAGENGKENEAGEEKENMLLREEMRQWLSN